MIETVFISDLHLHPEDKAIQARFDAFIAWAKEQSPGQLYILGDFFHAWAGDDSLNAWSLSIAEQISSLADAGIEVFYMAGNRDFLLGSDFAAKANWTVLSEPSLLSLGKEKILLVHGDRYCTKDWRHQLLRLFTRNKLFIAAFKRLSLQRREAIVNKVRMRSENKPPPAWEIMDVVASSVLHHMRSKRVHTLIHGHTHRPGVTSYKERGQTKLRYVLSDWDDNPQLLCYNITKGLYFTRI